jgi:hypothetical protein
MAKTLPLRQEELSVRHELSPEELLSQARKIMEIKEKVMQEGVHYGVIPGSRKPSLLKPGAEKLCSAFRLDPEFQTTSREDPNRKLEWERFDNRTRKKLQGTTVGYIEYESSCSRVHIPTGEIWARNVGGCCNNFEAAYKSLSPYDIKNTLEKMAEKRALVAAVLIGIGASDQFTQDIESLAFLMNGELKEPPLDEPQKQEPKTQAAQETKVQPIQEAKAQPIEQPKAPPIKETKTQPIEQPKAQATPESSQDEDETRRPATPKQIAYIRGEIERRKIKMEDFIEAWGEEFNSWDNLPFDLVNQVLEWIREQGSSKQKRF